MTFNGSFFKKPRRKGSKYGAVRSGDFPSKLEASVSQVLGLREKAGEIREIRRQSSVKLTPFVTWKVDFCAVLVETGETIWIEAKGVWTEAARIKLNLWRTLGPGKLEVWKGNFRSPQLDEIVIPRRGSE
jgi:hypothetical protein